MTFAHDAGLVSGLGHAPARPRVLPLSLSTLSFLVATFDVAWIVLLGIGSGVFYHGMILRQPVDWSDYIVSAVIVAALYSAFAHAGEVYRLPRLIRPGWQVARCSMIWVLLFVFLAALVFVRKTGALLSRGEMLLFFSSGLIAVATIRLAAANVCASLINSRSLAPRRIVVIASSAQTAAAELFQQLERFGYAVVATLKIPDLIVPEAANVLRERLHEVVVDIRGLTFDEIVLALPWDNPLLIDLIETELQVLPLPVKLLPDTGTTRILRHPLFDMGPITCVELQRAPLTEGQRHVKRFTDAIVASLALLALLPFFMVIAIAVRFESRGPILFHQVRIGFNGRPFRIFKFRTMATLDDGPVIVQASRNDSRVTRIGRLLRRLSIDELPQLLNVIKGDMSLVGPRPHALAHDNQYDHLIASYAMRRKMKPGITGWAQINGYRGETRDIAMMRRRVESDLWYIQHWSFWLDVRILLRTAVHIVKSHNAY